MNGFTLAYGIVCVGLVGSSLKLSIIKIASHSRPQASRHAMLNHSAAPGSLFPVAVPVIGDFSLVNAKQT